MRNNLRGFTLIEIMIVVSIVAILAAIAVPSYQEQVRKSRRSDATAALTAAASLQERWYFQFNGYTDSVDDIGGASGSLVSSEDFYTVAVSNNAGEGNCVGGGAIRFNCFTLTATPVAGTTQASDDDCASFTLTQLGERHAQNSSANDTTDQCW